MATVRIARCVAAPLRLAVICIVLVIASRSYAQIRSHVLHVELVGGIERNPSTGRLDVTSTGLSGVLTRFNLTANDLEAAFPERSPSDTLRYSPEGRPIRLPNLSHVYSIGI